MMEIYVNTSDSGFPVILEKILFSLILWYIISRMRMLISVAWK